MMTTSKPLKTSPESSLTAPDDNSPAGQHKSSSSSDYNSNRLTRAQMPTRAGDEQEALSAIKNNVEHNKCNGSSSNYNNNTNSHQHHQHQLIISDTNCSQMKGANGGKQEATFKRRSTINQNYQSIVDSGDQVQPEAALGINRRFLTLCPAWAASSLSLPLAPKSPSSRPLKSHSIVMNCLTGTLVVSVVMLLAMTGTTGRIEAVVAAAATTVTRSADGQQQQMVAATRAALESELEALLQQQQHESQDTNSKVLSEAIISRLMLGNLSDPTGASSDANLGDLMTVSELEGSPATDDSSSASSSSSATDLSETGASLNPDTLIGPDSVRLSKLLNYLHNYELSQAAATTTSGLNNGQVFDQFPVLPASQAATAKRASQKVGNYLRQQQQHSQQRQLNGYGRSTFDFGLGKRPDASVAGNILRLGDTGAHLQTVSGQFGKRPSAHRYDFGLGKRVASPAYPRYDFGLGKRSPNNRIRYDFGLGK